jgi:hypothetical protein
MWAPSRRNKLLPAGGSDEDKAEFILPLLALARLSDILLSRPAPPVYLTDASGNKSQRRLSGNPRHERPPAAD